MMAEPFDTLMEVQQHDTALDQLRRRREALPERAALAEVDRRRAELDRSVAEAQAQVDDLAGRQGILEEHIAATARRRHEIEQRMQSGAVSASRELQAMDHEVRQLADRQSHLEEEELVLMEEQEPFDAQLGGDRASLATLATEADRLSVAIHEAEAEIDEAIAAEAARREEVAVRLPAPLAERYEALRSHLGGVGAARLVGDRCDGCHLTLPSVEVERIRHLPPEEFATCPQCDRILVH
jgi:predicted  nucleic acid-binding Zn-ribbon protein